MYKILKTMVLLACILLILLFTSCVTKEKDYFVFPGSTESLMTISPPTTVSCQILIEDDEEISSIKNTYTFDELVDACEKITGCDEREYGTIDGEGYIQQELYSRELWGREDEPLPEDAYHILHIFNSQELVGFGCTQYDSEELTERIYRDCVNYAIRTGNHYNVIVNDTDEGYLFYWRKGYDFVVEILSGDCLVGYTLRDSFDEEWEEYIEFCKYLGWPYFDIETETMVYPENSEDIDANSITEEIAEPDDTTVQEETNEESQFLDDISI